MRGAERTRFSFTLIPHEFLTCLHPSDPGLPDERPDDCPDEWPDERPDDCPDERPDECPDDCPDEFPGRWPDRCPDRCPALDRMALDRAYESRGIRPALDPLLGREKGFPVLANSFQTIGKVRFQAPAQ